MAKIHAQFVDQTEPLCDIKKLAEVEGFQYTTTSDINKVTCGSCRIKLREQGYFITTPVALSQECHLFDINSLIGLPIRQAFNVFKANKSNIKFIRVIAEDGDRYDIDQQSIRNDRINLECENDIVVKAYIK